MRRTLFAAAALVALAAPLLSAAPSAAAPAEVRIKPAALERGPDVSGAHLHGTTIHDGDVRVTVNAARVLLYGKWNQFYIVAKGNAEWDNVRLVRVAKSGNTRLLVAGIDPFNTALDSVAGQVAYSYGDTTQRPTIGIYDLDEKREVISRSFSSLPRLLDFGLGQVVASFWSFNVRTLIWDTLLDITAKVNEKRSNYASVAHNLLGKFTKDPQFGGCQVLSHLRQKSEVLWKSCSERIEDASADGRRFATIPLLSDGIGPADVFVRKQGGARLAHYFINGWFGRIEWETNTKLLMESNGAVQAALVRCRVAECERASALRPTPDL